MDHPAPFASVGSGAGHEVLGPERPAGPVIISVPHAGREYDASLLAAARVRQEVLQRLEDRFADLLVRPLAERGVPLILARAPRAMIDLNRHEREVDPAMVTAVPAGHSLHSSIKLRGGLGLIPRRLPGAMELWQRPMPWAEVQRRIETIHRPYHAMLTRLMEAAREEHGHAILIDLHSMPPLPPASAGQKAPQLVLGDRFGRSASTRLVTLAADVARSYGVETALNHPYAGDHMLERHGKPGRGFHAIQVEVDRTLYLDAALDRPGQGMKRMREVIANISEALANEMPRVIYPLAAE